MDKWSRSGGEPEELAKATAKGQRKEEKGVTRKSFLETARSLNLDGPRDWSRRFEEYLYGENTGASD
ncbi:MAG: hypothetical protein D9V47_10300 [Clostridia bacterium]|nr:MAG: hypothetical protein D9V47_10300 [Clostridia bacterium]